MAHGPKPHTALTQAARRGFCAEVSAILPRVVQDIKDHVDGLMSTPQASRTLHAAGAEVQLHARDWIGAVGSMLQQQLDTTPDTPSRPAQADLDAAGLVADEAIEDQVWASRLASQILDAAGSGFADLRLRVLWAESAAELRPHDVFRPEVVARTLLQAWVHAGIPREAWKQLQDALGRSVSGHLAGAYQAANRYLVDHGVMPEIDLKHAVRRAPSAPVGPSAPAAAVASRAGGAPTASGVPPGVPTGAAAGPVSGAARGEAPAAPGDWWGRARQQGQEVVGRLMQLLAQQAPAWFPSVGAAPGHASAAAFAPTAVHVPPTPPGAVPAPPVPAPSGRLQNLLAQTMLLQVPRTASGTPSGQAEAITVAQADMSQYLELVRQHSQRLKRATDVPSEKATIEVVALMFQSILTEERLRPSLRVWFARLQIPVLRVALAEPDFFSSLEHPARRLIDRMGSCALGFDANLADDGSTQALEAEIRRLVQLIEQYPETGRRVFQLALDEFQRFLTRHLQSRGQASRLVSVAQQVELKETRAVQYTIELRKQLGDMPVPPDIRDFLFKVWAEVLAVASVKHDPQHEVMRSLKRVAADLLWSASAKPTRAERSRVIAQLPHLLDRLRKGMTLLGLDAATQEAHVKRISDTLADAFMSKTETIPAAKLAAVTRNLSSLEDFLPPGDDADLALDQDSIEMITGVDASNIEIITQGGRPPAEAARAWARELQLGSWFTLDHNGHVAQVQLAWRSAHGQLCLFATAQQRLYLIQTARVASYLQAGLLVPVEQEPLTVRATRAALEKLDANPERLLA